jgi:RNA polymerase sigma-70 factor (ECF subfamily)
MRNTEDQIVIERIKAGEIDQYAVLVKKYSKIVYSFIAQRLFDKNEVDDLAQNAFLKFYKALDRFDTEREVLPYLLEIAKNEMKMYFRSHKNSLSLDEKILTTSSIEVFIDEISDLDGLLNSLSKDQKKALLLVGEGYSYQEVAKELKKPLNTVKTIVRRGRMTLQDIIKKHEKT